MNDVELMQWLLENGGPAIRYRTALELAADLIDVDIAQLTTDLLASPMTQLWLDEQAQAISGVYMRLEENRRSRQSLDLDSTFRMLKIKVLVIG